MGVESGGAVDLLLSPVLLVLPAYKDLLNMTSTR